MSYIFCSLNWIFLVGLSLLLSAYSQDIFQTSSDKTCIAVANEGDGVDFLCKFDTPLSCHAEQSKIRWVHHSANRRTTVEDNTKYGLWDGGSTNNEVASLLRIRNVSSEGDIGMVKCGLYCGPALSAVQYMELCVKHRTTGLVKCGLTTKEDSCLYLFANSECNEACGSESELFDGGDCDSSLRSPCPNEDQCVSEYKNGVCNQACSGAQCAFDGGECLELGIQVIVRETIGIGISYSSSPEDITRLVREISIKLTTLVDLENGDHRKNWTVIDNHDMKTLYVNPGRLPANNQPLKLLRLKLIPRDCVNCFMRVLNAAKYLTHHLNKDPSYISLPISIIGVFSALDDCTTYTGSVPGSGSYIPNRPNYTTQIVTHITNYTSKSKGSHTLSFGEIIGISLCALALLMLIVGVAIACQYQQRLQRAKRRAAQEKQAKVRKYLDEIPEQTPNEQPNEPKEFRSPSLSMNRSVTSKDKILPRSVSTNHTIDEDVCVDTVLSRC